MANEVKKKIVSINGSIKTKVVDGERRIVFVASSANQDRHYEHVNVASLRLPLKGGGEITVDAIPAEGVANIIDIPLMLNHSGDVRDVIGSVRSAFFENSELIFEAGISSREIAQEMLTLIEEGHLSNSFSITMIDYDYNFDAETISNAEVIEVSLVYRGSNKEARLIAIKSLIGGNKMDGKSKQNDTFGTANGDGKDHNPSEKPADTPKDETPAETTETQDEPQSDEAPEETPESEEQEGAPAESEANETPGNEQTNPNQEENEMEKEIAKDNVVEKSTMPVQKAAVKSAYLKTKEALRDFRDIVLKNHRGSNEKIMSEWMTHLKQKDIDGDAIMPSRIENIFFKAWIDNPGILGTFRFLAVKNGSVYAGTSSDTALGHTKGQTKKNQTIELIRRDLKAVAVYKKLLIDMQDLFDDETGELLAFRVEELAARIANAIAVGAIISAGTGVDATLQGTRGLNPMIADLNATDGFGAQVATKVTAVTGDGNYEKAIRALGAVKDVNGTGAGRILIVGEGFLTSMRLQKDSDGRLMFAPGSDMATMTGAKAIFEMPEMAGSGYDVIAYLDQSYVLVGEANGSVRTDFDTTVNKDIMLQERYVGGSAQGYKTVAGVATAD